MKKHLSAFFFGSALSLTMFVPSFLYAAPGDPAGCGGVNDIAKLLCEFGNLVGTATGVLAALALLVFLWGLVKYIAKADDEKAKEQGENIMVGGVVALFVLFSVFGIIKFLQTSFGVDNANAPTVPKITIPRSS